MAEPTQRFVVRFPERLRRQLDEAARLYRRSVNAEILARLEHSLNGLPDQSSERAVEPPLFQAIERMRQGSLTHDEARLLRGFKRLPQGKRDALLELLS